MAPLTPTSRSKIINLAQRAAVNAGPHLLHYFARHALVPRGLSVNKAQEVTLGITIAYVLIIALLWNIPYVRMILWPFKVLYLY